VENADDLWPPFGPTAASRGHLARRARPSDGSREQGQDRGRDQAPDQRQDRGRDHRQDRGRDHRQGRGADQPGRRAGPSQRGRNRAGPPLSRSDIVDAAIAIADSAGPGAVSMRKIAQLLRAGTMTLYWHVANKEHLLDLMLDELVGQIPSPERSGDWRADLQELARNQRSMLLAHRWVMDFIGGRPSLGPNTLLNLESSLAALDGLGLDMVTSLNILTTVSTYVLGAVLRELRELRDQRDQEQWSVDSDQWRALMMQWRRNLEADGRFGHFIKIIDERIDPDAPETRDERFEFGLDCVLEGIAAQIARRAQPAAG
jgi:AcrR family transcriptional regulator